jgi:hypothetical protein
MMCQSRVRGLGHKRKRGITLPHRNRAEEAAGERISGEKFRSRRCGFEQRSKRGEGEDARGYL